MSGQVTVTVPQPKTPVGVQIDQNLTVIPLGIQWYRGWKTLAFRLINAGQEIDAVSLYGTKYRIGPNEPSPYTIAFLILPRMFTDGFVTIQGRQFSL